MVWAAAAMELCHPVSVPKTAVPILVEALARPGAREADDLFAGQAIFALGSLSGRVPEAREAIPPLLAIACDPESPWRATAISALGDIANELGWTRRMGPIPVDSEEARWVRTIRDGLRPLLEENDPSLRATLDLQFRRFRTMRWLK
jgi:hypothetical protein